jgi:uncharacterized protein YukE
MEKLLQKLLEAEVLSADTKKELEVAFQKQLNEAIAAAKEEAAADVRAELTEQWINEKETLIEAIDNKVGDFLDSEISELKSDIERFRDLEAEYAGKLVEAKKEMTKELKNDLKELVEKLDTFLEIRLSAEIEELREDLENVRQKDFGRRVFEAFQHEFMKNYVDSNGIQKSVSELEQRLRDTEEALEESERVRSQMVRDRKLVEVLSPLSGRSRDVMEAILKNVDTDHLEEAYKTFIGRVIREAADTTGSEKEGKVLAEGKSEQVKATITKTGDNAETLTESEKASKGEASSKLDHLRRLAGIK